jgi:cyclopropane-fatty-acyl-phospholipid synthase
MGAAGLSPVGQIGDRQADSPLLIGKVMANQREIEALYDWLDYFHELGIGECADITAALFDGDFTKSLSQAQNDKHDWIFDGLNIEAPRTRILDIGCGNGPTLKAIKERGGEGLGITLSRAQADYCQRHGLDARVMDWKEIDTTALGPFDGVVSIGAFEHFCSEEEYNAGRQLEIYDRFFDVCARLLPDHGRLYLQTMTWGKQVPVSAAIRLDAPEGSPERILARLRKFYPGSWLPSGKEQIVSAAASRFRLVTSNNGRKDYIETLNRWGAGADSLWTAPKIFKVIPAILRLVPRYVSSPDFRVQISSLQHHDQQTCLIQEIMSHERMFFQKLN